MKRGDLLPIAMAGDYGKPRPAVIVQSDAISGSDSVLVCLLTTDDQPAVLRRIVVEASVENGLIEKSQIMVEKIFAVRRDKCRPPFGRLENDTMSELDIALMSVLGLAEAH